MAGLAGALVPARAAHTPDRSFIALRRQWREVSAGAVFDPRVEPYRTRLGRLGAAAGRFRETMAFAAGGLWADLPFPSFMGTPQRLRTMAQAYVLPGTGVTGDSRLGAAVAQGIDHYRRTVYPAGGDASGNWWHWQIGVPRSLLDAALLVGGHVTEQQSRDLRDSVDHYVPESLLGRYGGNSTAANRVDLCLVMLLRAILRADPEKADLAVSALAPVFRYVEEGDGFYRDGSFIQHSTIPYQGAYGATLLAGLATLFAVLRGTPWATTDNTIHDLVERSFTPFIHDGVCMDLVRGRGISRDPFGDHKAGREIAASILLLAESAPERARWQAVVKGWAHRNKPMLAKAERTDLAFHARLSRVLNDPAIPAATEPTGHHLMPMSARAVHRRPGWCAALSMASDRVGHYEHGNGENLRGWHTGSGMLYWWAGGHADQYSDSFWHTVDPYRLPGTTVSTRPLPDGAGPGWGDTCPPARWVGGATDGVYAGVGQHLNGFESTLEAFKSWFFLDDAVLCLGAGITAADDVPVETIVDNRRTTTPPVVNAAEGWAHLAGHGGYVFLPGTEADPPAPALRTGQTVHQLRGGTRLHTRHDRRTSATTRVTRGYATFWLDHGTNPASAGYAYLLMPGATQAETRARAALPAWARILANTSAQQAVHVPSLALTAANFWLAGTVGDLTASAPCAVLLRQSGTGTAALTVADPRRDLTTLTVTWRRPVSGLIHGHPLLAAHTTGPDLTLTFRDLDTHAGASITVTVQTGVV